MASGNSSPASKTHAADHDDGAGANIPLSTDAMLAAVEEAMEDAVPNNIPPPPVETRRVSLTFNGSGGQSVTFKLKNTMKFRKAMEHYSAKVQLPVDQLRFLFEGQRLGLDDTPATHEMEDGDIVDVHMEQLGGGCAAFNEDWEDWVFVATDEHLLQRTVSEKARLSVLIDRLKKEVSALKADNRALASNNRAFAKENNDLKTDYKEINDDRNDLFVAFSKVMSEYHNVGASLARFKKMFDNETRILNASIAQKDNAIDSILRDFQFTLEEGESISGM